MGKNENYTVKAGDIITNIGLQKLFNLTELPARLKFVLVDLVEIAQKIQKTRLETIKKYADKLNILPDEQGNYSFPKEFDNRKLLKELDDLLSENITLSIWIRMEDLMNETYLIHQELNAQEIHNLLIFMDRNEVEEWLDKQG